MSYRGSGGGGRMVCMLALYSDDLSLNPTEVYRFLFCLKRTKIMQKDVPRLAHFLNTSNNAL